MREKTFATLFLVALVGIGILSYKYKQLQNSYDLMKYERNEAQHQFKMCKFLYKRGC